MTEKLISSAGFLRYWKAAPLFRRRMLRSMPVAAIIVCGWIVLFAILG